MATKLRFYLDENIPVEVAKQLRAQDIDAVTVRDLGLLGAPDRVHLERATAEERVLCTYDSDSCWLLNSSAGLHQTEPG